MLIVALQTAAPTGSLTSTLRAEDDTTPDPPLAATIDPTEAAAAADQAGPSKPPGTAPDDEVEGEADGGAEPPEADDESKGLSELASCATPNRPQPCLSWCGVFNEGWFNSCSWHSGVMLLQLTRIASDLFPQLVHDISKRQEQGTHSAVAG